MLLAGLVIVYLVPVPSLFACKCSHMAKFYEREIHSLLGPFVLCVTPPILPLLSPLPRTCPSIHSQLPYSPVHLQMCKWLSLSFIGL